jgi:hypothetical protein
MKTRLYELKKLVREAVYQQHVNILNENIMSDIWSLVFSNKIQKAIKLYKDEPEYKELARQIKISSKELEMVADRLKRTINRKEALIQKLQSKGIKIDVGMSVEEMLAVLPNVSMKDIDKMAKKYK